MSLFDKELKVGSKVLIESFSGSQVIIERLHELGLRVGTELTILGAAPFAGPLLVQYKSTLLALRQEEAQCTIVSKSPQI